MVVLNHRQPIYSHRHELADMADTTVTVDDPDAVEKKDVDSSGRVYLGKDYADERVRIVIERLDDND